MTEEATGSKANAPDEEQAVEDGSRAGELGETDEPDAPTAEEENAGMSDILSPGPFTGVQDDASDE
ncbi:MAG TPA: hypothetical protein VGC91_01780 [Pyrinomonadaceae bacterium]